MNQKFRFTSSMTYELPFGKGKKWMNSRGWMNWILGGYSFAWNYSQWTPTPTSISYSGASYLNPVTGALGGRQDYPGYEPLPGSQAFLLKTPEIRDGWQDIGGNRWTQATQNSLITNCGTAITNWGNQCIAVAPSFVNGNMPGNFWTPQRIIAANASIYKDFPIKERFKGQLRLDFMNPFKWYNWNTVQTSMAQTSPGLFGTVAGPSDFNDSVEGGPPQLLLSFRVKF
jgi:hypothetical protein